MPPLFSWRIRVISYRSLAELHSQKNSYLKQALKIQWFVSFFAGNAPIHFAIFERNCSPKFPYILNSNILWLWFKEIKSFVPMKRSWKLLNRDPYAATRFILKEYESFHKDFENILSLFTWSFYINFFWNLFIFIIKLLLP